MDKDQYRKQMFIPHARRAILMALRQEQGWHKACENWLLDYDLICLDNAIKLEDGVDERL